MSAISAEQSFARSINIDLCEQEAQMLSFLNKNMIFADYPEMYYVDYKKDMHKSLQNVEVRLQLAAYLPSFIHLMVNRIVPAYQKYAEQQPNESLPDFRLFRLSYKEVVNVMREFDMPIPDFRDFLAMNSDLMPVRVYILSDPSQNWMFIRNENLENFDMHAIEKANNDNVLEIVME
jgi:hypothetical protein